jgi:hypothetical protein
VIFGGLEGLAFFVMMLFYLLTHKKILAKDTNTTNTVCIATILFWLGIKYYLVETKGLEYILPSIVMSASGAIIGSLIFLQIYYLIKSRIKKAKMRMQYNNPIIRTSASTNKIIPSKEDLGYTIYTNPKFKEIFGGALFQNYSVVDEQLEETILSSAEKSVDEAEQLD